MSYQIYRHKKHGHAGTIAASARHMMRTRPTSNANPARRNHVLIGSGDPAADVAALLPKVGERGSDGVLRRRANSVLAVEVLLTASPEWWQAASREQKRDWLDSSTAWLTETYGRTNIAHLQLHQDETTPHLTGMIVPIDPATGRLNARRWLGGGEQCSKLQSSCAAAVSHLGLERGVEGSTATHQRVSQHYTELNRKFDGVTVECPPRILIDPERWQEQQRASVVRQIAPVTARARESIRAKRNAKAMRDTAHKATERAKQAEAARDAAKAVADRMRSLDLPDVLEALGLSKDKQSPESKETPCWKDHRHSIAVTNRKWWDHRAGKGGGGAIDLAMHVMEVDFKAATAWLAAQFGANRATADMSATLVRRANQQVKQAVEECPPFTPPKAVSANWTQVREWLIQVHGLPAETVDELHARGDLYADARRNAVFLARDQAGTVTGAELEGTVGTPFRGIAPGSTRAAGFFRLGDLKARAVYLVESAVDAISLWVMRRRDGDTDCAIISTAGAAYSVPLTLKRVLGSDVLRWCAYRADEIGDKAARAMASAGWSRHRPERGGTWNDQLRAEPSTGSQGLNSTPESALQSGKGSDSKKHAEDESSEIQERPPLSR